MIKQAIINRLKFSLKAGAIFLACYLARINLIVPLFLTSLMIYLEFSNIDLKIKNCNFANLTLLFLIIAAVSNIIVLNNWPIFYIPFSLIPILSMLLFDSLQLSLLVSLTTSVIIAAFTNNNYLVFMLSLTSGIFSCLLTKDVRRRMVIIKTGFLIGLIQALALLLILRFKIHQSQNYFILIVNGIACSIIVIGILPLFEYLFKTVTNISLLELADFNSPLLQRLTIEAPGTYHHSLIVGNLSDAACKVVGANALLARIGAYYHDIGKLSKPNYFSENQIMESNKHDDLSPDMSKLIIMNHVKEGLELARKYKLNPSLTEFIQCHHGSSLVYYFYRRALENLDNNQEIAEEGFRYPGPKPQTKETAIVLLADSVEAATRTLREPTPAKITELVHKIINNKFIDGQLDECELTLKDLEKISVVFIHILSGIYHTRISYPEDNTPAES